MRCTSSSSRTLVLIPNAPVVFGIFGMQAGVQILPSHAPYRIPFLVSSEISHLVRLIF